VRRRRGRPQVRLIDLNSGAAKEPYQVSQPGWDEFKAEDVLEPLAQRRRNRDLGVGRRLDFLHGQALLRVGCSEQMVTATGDT